MLQAFVSLKPQQPARTENGMTSFFEALENAVFSQPTIFRSNTDAAARPYSIEAVVEAALKPNCKFIVLRADCEKFWQCTFLLPDAQGVGALHFDLQRVDNPRKISATTLVNMFKNLYQSIKPKLVRVGDSEARKKLKSRHGIIMMPGIGRVEWLQIVSQDVYGDIYNPSDLVGAPCYQSDVWEDNSFFLRVYDDPNDWDSEDNESYANFVPGFLAGISKIKDGEKEKEMLRELERLCSRAEKTAEKAYAALDNASIHTSPAKAEVEEEHEAPSQEAAPVEESSAPVADVDEETAHKRSVIFTRIKDEFKVEEQDIIKRAVEGPCTVFTVKRKKKPDMCVSYQDSANKVYILNNTDDLSKFIKDNGCKLNEESIPKLVHLLSYYHPENKILATLDDLPDHVAKDKRVPGFKEKYAFGKITNTEGTLELLVPVFQPECDGLEIVSLSQFEAWPIQITSEVVATEMENVKEKPAPEKKEEPKVEEKKEEPKVEEKKEEPKAEEKKEEPKAEEKKEEPKAGEKKEGKTDLAVAEKAEVPAKQGGNKAVVIILIVIAVLYLAAVFYCDMDPALGKIMEMLNK